MYGICVRKTSFATISARRSGKVAQTSGLPTKSDIDSAFGAPAQPSRIMVDHDARLHGRGQAASWPRLLRLQTLYHFFSVPNFFFCSNFIENLPAVKIVKTRGRRTASSPARDRLSRVFVRDGFSEFASNPACFSEPPDGIRTGFWRNFTKWSNLNVGASW